MDASNYPAWGEELYWCLADAQDCASRAWSHFERDTHPFEVVP